jgi:predicted GNAT family N-acyltransferase
MIAPIPIAIADSDAARAACFAVRRAVFIEEQAIPEAEEWDDHDAPDAACRHYLAGSVAAPAGTARLIPQGDIAKIGRVAVLPAFRGTGLGRRLMRRLLDDAQAGGHRAAVLEAQVAVIPFYAGLGFVAEGTVYDDGSGILHRLMRKSLTTAAA